MKKGIVITLVVVSFVLSNALAVVITWLVLRPTQEAPVADPTPLVSPGAENTDNSVPLSQPEPISSEPLLVVPDNWEEFASVEYETEFSYPPEWGAPTAELITGVNDSLFTFPELAIGFGDGVPLSRSVRVASVSDVVSEADTALQDVYSDRDVTALTGLETLATPPVNAGLYGYTDPVYIQNPSGSFRGFYAHTLHVQNDPSFGGNIELSELLMQLTDGETVVQVLIKVDAFATVNYTAAGSCNATSVASGASHTCAFPRELNLDQQNLLILATSLEKLKSL